MVGGLCPKPITERTKRVRAAAQHTTMPRGGDMPWCICFGVARSSGMRLFAAIRVGGRAVAGRRPLAVAPGFGPQRRVIGGAAKGSAAEHLLEQHQQLLLWRLSHLSGLISLIRASGGRPTRTFFVDAIAHRAPLVEGDPTNAEQRLSREPPGTPTKATETRSADLAEPQRVPNSAFPLGWLRVD